MFDGAWIHFTGETAEWLSTRTAGSNKTGEVALTYRNGGSFQTILCSFFQSVGIIRPAHVSPFRIMPRHRHPTATAKGRRRFGLPATTPVQARRRSLPRPAPAPPPSTVTHAPGNEVPARPAAASRCSLRSRLSLSASVSPRRFRRKRGIRSVLPVCRRQPSRRMLPR